MANVRSRRAKELLERPMCFRTEKSPGMRHYPGQGLDLWIEVEREGQFVKKMCFSGELEPWQQALLESMARIMLGKDLGSLEGLSVRECEAFLRDRNSEPALENLPEETERIFKSLFTWIRLSPTSSGAKEYRFASSVPFRHLKPADKVRELKEFLNSFVVIELYQGLSRPELVDLDEMTLYVEVPYETEREKALFEDLHMLGVSTFGEEDLNFIPEA